MESLAQRPTLTVVIPVYNGAKTIGPLVDTLEKELASIDFDVVLVNDGSVDNSEQVCTSIAEQKGYVTFISLRKNFGEHNAVMCGLNHARGEYVVIIDDDFQNPPSEIIKLLRKAQEGYDVVFSKYSEKQHSWFRNLGSKLNDIAANYLLGKPKYLYLSSFKCIHHEIVAEIIKYEGPFPYIDGLILRVTRNFATVMVRHDKRLEGKSNYTLKKLISLYLNMFLNFSILPIRYFTFSGFVIFCLGLILSIVFIIWKIIDPTVEAGWTSLVVIIFTFSGFQIMFLGLIGEYLGKQYLDQNKTPQWVIKKIIKPGG